jgi:hypothetical protein
LDTDDDHRREASEIDHIYPRCALPHSHPEDENFKKLWAISNLRPLWWWENRAKISEDVALKKKLIKSGELVLPSQLNR